MRKGAKELLVIILSIVVINSIFISAITGSMGNARMILYPEVNGWTTTTIEKSILTRNVNEDSIKVELKIDEGGEEFLELIDETFILNPDEEKKAKFLVKVKKEGTYNGKINVFFSPLEGKEPGVVLSSTIIVIAEKTQDYQEAEEDEKSESEVIEDEESSDEVVGNEKSETGGVDIGIGNTGNVIASDDGKSKSSGIWKGVLVGNILILIIILIALIFFMIKKRLKRKKRRKKRRGKKSGKRRRKRK